MVVVFEKEYLQELYTTGSCKEKKYRCKIEVAKRYKRAIDYLKWASRKEDLFRINSLNFEALKGKKVGLFSVRVNDQYRIEFSIQEDMEQPILSVCNIVELSNHYS